MNKKEKIKELKDLIQQHKIKINNLEDEIQTISSLNEWSISDLIQHFESKISGSMTKRIEKDTFIVNLGGDGRTSPDSEKRTDDVLKINIPAIYIAPDDFKKFIQYIEATKKPNSFKAIFFNNNQIYYK